MLGLPVGRRLLNARGEGNVIRGFGAVEKDSGDYNDQQTKGKKRTEEVFLLTFFYRLFVPPLFRGATCWFVLKGEISFISL